MSEASYYRDHWVTVEPERLDREQPPVAVDHVREPARAERRAKLGERVRGIVHVLEHVLGDHAIDGAGLEREHVVRHG